MVLFLRFVIYAIALLFLLPMAVAGAWWTQVDRPASWRSADWGASGLLPQPEAENAAAVYVMAARTGGFKGAFSVHSWIVTKGEGDGEYTRYEKVGWGRPVRVNAYAADANWYSNRPHIIKELHGEAAAAVIPQIEAAIADYPHSDTGAYTIWPGPNSNSFVAHVLREVPALDAILPPNAVGRDYLGASRWFAADPDGRDFHVSLAGYAGFSIGVRSGIEIHLLGQSAGIDILRPALKIPGIGRIGTTL